MTNLYDKTTAVWRPMAHDIVTMAAYGDVGSFEGCEVYGRLQRHISNPEGLPHIGHASHEL
jgi:hypothetical protein